jgi:hypothetical protein
MAKKIMRNIPEQIVLDEVWKENYQIFEGGNSVVNISDIFFLSVWIYHIFTCAVVYKMCPVSPEKGFPVQNYNMSKFKENLS